MADFQVLFDTDGVKIDKPLWGSTHLPNQEIDPEHWDKFWENYSTTGPISIWLDSGNFIMTASQSFIEGTANYSHKIVTQDSDFNLMVTGNFDQHYDANDAMGLKDVTSDFVIPTDSTNILSETNETIDADRTFAWYFNVRPNETNWEARLYFGAGAFGLITPNTPAYYLSVSGGGHVLCAHDGTGWKTVAKGNLNSGSSMDEQNHCILIHPSREDRIYITNGYAPQTNNMFYRVPAAQEQNKPEEWEVVSIIPKGKLGVYVSNTSIISVISKYVFPTTVTASNGQQTRDFGVIYGPVITLPDKDDPATSDDESQVDLYGNISMETHGRFFGMAGRSPDNPTGEARMGFADVEGNYLSAGDKANQFRWYVEMSSNDAKYSPELIKVVLRRLPTSSIESNEIDQVSNVLGVHLGLNEDLTAKQMGLDIKENVNSDFEGYAGRSMIPIRLKYLGKNIFLGISGNNPFNLNAFQNMGNIDVLDFWKRMELIRLGNVAAFDGMIITEVYREILEAAGIRDINETAATPNYRIYENGTVTLDLPRGDGDLLYAPKPSTSVAELLLDIRDNNTQDIMYFDGNGTLNIERNWFSGIGGASVPASSRTFYSDTTTAIAATSPYTVRGFSQVVDDSDFANVVYVIGWNQDEQKPIIAVAIDDNSVNNLAAPNYTGIEVEAWHFNNSLATQEGVNAVCLAEYEFLRNRKIVGSWKSAWDEDIGINDVVTISTSAGHMLENSTWRIKALDVNIGQEALQKPTGMSRAKYWEATYTGLRITPATKTVGFNNANPVAPGDPA